MRLLLITLLPLCFFQISCQQQSADSMKKKVLDTHQYFIAGIIAEDHQRVGNVLSDDMSFGFPGGGFGTKQDYINALKSGNLVYDSVFNHVPNIKIYGKTGVVNGNLDLLFRYKDETGAWFKMLEHLSFTSVFLVDNKSTKMISWQSTRPTTDEAIELLPENR